MVFFMFDVLTVCQYFNIIVVLLFLRFTFCVLRFSCFVFRVVRVWQCGSLCFLHQFLPFSSLQIDSPELSSWVFSLDYFITFDKRDFIKTDQII